MNSVDLLEVIKDEIESQKGFNVSCLDVSGKCSFTDYMVVAEGFVQLHVYNIYQSVQRKLKKRAMKFPLKKTVKISDWMVLDCGNVVVHIFVSSERVKYDLEGLWNE